MAPPPNDDFASATAIAGTSGFVDGTSVDATADWPDVEQSFGNGNTWFAWTCPADGAYEFDTAALPDLPANLNATTITVYIDAEGSGFASLVYVALDIFGSGGGPPGTLRSKVSFGAKAGVTYYIEVDDYDFGTGGAYRLTWSELTATAAPADCSATVFPHPNPGQLFLIQSDLATPLNAGDKVYEYEIWRGPSPASLTLLATVEPGGQPGADIEKVIGGETDASARLDLSSNATPLGSSIYWDDPGPAYPVYYRFKAINSFGFAWSAVYGFAGPFGVVSDNGGVGETLAGSGSSVDVTLTADVPAGGPTVGSFLIVSFSLVGPPAGADPFTTLPVPTITDTAPISAPYFKPNEFIPNVWGLFPTTGPPYQTLFFGLYIVRNKLSIGDVVTVSVPVTTQRFDVRLHAFTGFNVAGSLTEAFRPSDPDDPNPPYSAGSPRPGGHSFPNRFGSFGDDWLSDFVVLFSGLAYTGGVAPVAAFRIESSPTTFNLDETEQFHFDDTGFTWNHHFYAFATITDYTDSSNPAAFVEYGGGGWGPLLFRLLSGGASVVANDEGIGYLILNAGPGEPLPNSVHASHHA